MQYVWLGAGKVRETLGLMPVSLQRENPLNDVMVTTENMFIRTKFTFKKEMSVLM